jgi:DNA repair photolyase
MKIEHRYKSKTGIAPTEGFKKKRLAAYSVNVGNVCEFGCAYCYVPDMPFQHQSVKNLRQQGYEIGEFSNYRTFDDLMSTVSRDAKKFEPGDASTVIFCTTCDPCATHEHVDMTTAAAKVILENTDLTIRILSKSTNIQHVAQSLSAYRDRVAYGLSTGTCCPEVSRAIETSASPILERVKALHCLQDNGYRTFGMICPVLPSEKGMVVKLLDQVRPELCEEIWVEAINDKGNSLTGTHDAFCLAGLDWHAYAIRKVMESKVAWRNYSAELFLAFLKELKKRKLSKKLHFLQYVTKEDMDFFANHPEAICL